MPFTALRSSPAATRFCCLSVIICIYPTPVRDARPNSSPSPGQKNVQFPPSKAPMKASSLITAQSAANSSMQRAGYYLCFFGMHVLTPAVQRILGELLAAAKGSEASVNFRAAVARLATHERYLACELEGRRYDFGVKYGLLTAQLALALSGKERDEVLRGLVELLATK